MSDDGLSDSFKHFLDYASIGAAVGAFFQLLPNVAALLSVVWLALRIWETDTVKGWTGRDAR